jgi:hypothetical protein
VLLCFFFIFIFAFFFHSSLPNGPQSLLVTRPDSCGGCSAALALRRYRGVEHCVRPRPLCVRICVAQRTLPAVLRRFVMLAQASQQRQCACVCMRVYVCARRASGEAQWYSQRRGRFGILSTAALARACASFFFLFSLFVTPLVLFLPTLSAVRARGRSVCRRVRVHNQNLCLKVKNFCVLAPTPPVGPSLNKQANTAYARSLICVFNELIWFFCPGGGGRPINSLIRAPCSHSRRVRACLARASSRRLRHAPMRAGAAGAGVRLQQRGQRREPATEEERSKECGEKHARTRVHASVAAQRAPAHRARRAPTPATTAAAAATVAAVYARAHACERVYVWSRHPWAVALFMPCRRRRRRLP